MSTFAVNVVRIDDVVSIPNAERVEIAVVSGFNVVVGKGNFRVGDWAAYIPEFSLVPEWLMKRLNVWNNEKNEGMLAGKDHNRVKIKKILEIYSQGLLYPIKKDDVDGEEIGWLDIGEMSATDPGGYVHPRGEVSTEVRLGDDVAQILGVTKWEPPVPTCLAGQVCNIAGHTLDFDVENGQKHRGVLQEGEEAVATEKLHGTNIQIGILPDFTHPELFFDGSVYCGSKGLSKQGLVFKNNEDNQKVAYVRALNSLSEQIARILERAKEIGQPIFLVGELIGPASTQDLTYSVKDFDVRFFGVHIGRKGRGGKYLDFDAFQAFLTEFNLKSVPVLHTGPYNLDEFLKFRDGVSALDGKTLKEGIVITPRFERRDNNIGRVILKEVSPAYLTRKGGTEYT